MFDRVLRELQELESGIDIPVAVRIDEDGYYDRRCPSSECEFAFKVLFEDWTAKVPDNTAYCPFCGHSAQPEEFNTPEQAIYFEKAGLAGEGSRINQAMDADVQAFNRHPQHGFITMQLANNSSPIRIPLPPDAARAMTLRISCEVCGCRFAVVGTAYFCPACKYNSANQTFNQSLAIARGTIMSLDDIKRVLPDRDASAQVAKSLIEGTFGMLVTAFQRFAEVTYQKLPHPTMIPRRNAFQNLTEGSRLWHNAGGRVYADNLGAEEMTALIRLFQQRHLLAHQEGIVDQDYLDRTGDKTYTIGQRLVIREQADLELADLLDKLVAGMRADLLP